MTNDPREELCPGLHIVRVCSCSECISCQSEPIQLHSSRWLVAAISHNAMRVIVKRAVFRFK